MVGVREKRDLKEQKVSDNRVENNVLVEGTMEDLEFLE